MFKSNALIGWILLSIALLFYLYGVYLAIYTSWPAQTSTDNLSIPDGIDAAIASLNALLLTNLGAVLGISVTNPTAALSRSILMKKVNADDKAIELPIKSQELVQLISLLVFLVSLVACFITWIHNDFSSNTKDVLPFVSQSAKMFIGVCVAYLAFVLGANTTH